jgi:thiol-disulfide isomerase/thioredoxin
LGCKPNASKENDLTDLSTIPVLTFQELKPYLTAIDDGVHIVNFWATWCAPCVKELPLFQELQDRYPSQLKVTLVSLDFPDQIQEKLIPFIEKNKLTPQVVLLNDPMENEWIPKIHASWSGALPATLIISDEDRVFHEGSFTKEQLVMQVEKILKL